MKLFKSTIICFVFITLATTVASCETVYDDDFLRNSDEKLCNKNWINEYTEANGNKHTYELYFDRNGSGREKSVTHLGAQKETVITDFYWKWINNGEGIELSFPKNEVIFFDNVWVRDHYLSGNYDGVDITFLRD